jgi:hypothetical protein
MRICKPILIEVILKLPPHYECYLLTKDSTFFEVWIYFDYKTYTKLYDVNYCLAILSKVVKWQKIKVMHCNLKLIATIYFIFINSNQRDKIMSITKYWTQLKNS